MTTPLQNGSATEIDLLAADWLQRRNFWKWSAEDEAALQSWLDQSRAHRIAYWRQKAVWDSAQRLVALRPLGAMRRSESPRSNRSLVFKIAAATIAVCAIGAGGITYLQKPAHQESVYSTPVGGRETITLFDGSQIELNTDTTLRVRKSGRERLAILETGEAFFNIKHDAAHPFSLSVAGSRIVDLGTKFAVRNIPGRLEVSLLEGRASYQSGNSPRVLVLQPGDVVIATAGATKIIRKSSNELSTELGWRRGRLTFYRTTLADAVAEMNRYNERKIVIADSSAGKELIDGTFPSNDVDLFGRVAHSVLGLRVSDNGSSIVISR